MSALKTDYWDQYKSGRMQVPVQMGLAKHKEFPDVPNAYELAKSDEDRQLFQLIFGPWSYGRPIYAPPGTEPGAARRIARGVGRDAEGPGLHRGDEEDQHGDPAAAARTIAKLVDQIMSTPAPVVERARQVLGVANR